MTLDFCQCVCWMDAPNLHSKVAESLLDVSLVFRKNANLDDSEFAVKSKIGEIDVEFDPLSMNAFSEESKVGEYGRNNNECGFDRLKLGTSELHVLIDAGACGSIIRWDQSRPHRKNCGNSFCVRPAAIVFVA